EPNIEWIAAHSPQAKGRIEPAIAFNMALSYDIPGPVGNRALRALLDHWSVDSILASRTAVPVNVYIDPGDPPFPGLPPYQMRPDRVPGVPFYLQDGTLPGGRRLNPAAFAVPPDPRQGNLVRNSLRGFAVTQWDFDLRRQFRI